jgi:hypothetical protein
MKQSFSNLRLNDIQILVLKSYLTYASKNSLIFDFCLFIE